MRKPVKLNSDNTIEFEKRLIRPTPPSQMSLAHRVCAHEYHVVNGTGKENGYGCPTWCCVRCGHRVVSI